MRQANEERPPWWSGPLMVLLCAFCAKLGEHLAEWVMSKTEKTPEQEQEKRVKEASRWENP